MFPFQFALPTVGVQDDFPIEYEHDREELILAEARAIAHRRLQGLCFLESPQEVADYLILRFAGQKEELFTCLFLDNRNRTLAFEVLFRGSISSCEVHPREVVREALRSNAAAVILAHNHPSGIAEPSASDRAITLRLKDALALIDVRVLDHLVIGGDQSVSFATRGWL